MLPETSIAPAPQPVSVPAILGARGFARVGRSYCKDGLSFVCRGRWFAFTEQPASAEPWSLSCGMGQPGLWKWIQNGAPLHRVFELPAWVIGENPEEDRRDESGPASFDNLVDWVLASRDGTVPREWRLPDEKLVGSWLGHGALTVQSKGCVRQGDLILRPGCWALRMPVLHRLPDELPQHRRAAFTELVADAQRHWAMVRIGAPADLSPAALVAEVDFTGAPHSELLFSAGLDAIKHAVAWLAEAAEVLTDPAILIQCLASAAFTPTPTPNERNGHHEHPRH